MSGISLTDALGLSNGSVVSIVGCGGKTSTIRSLYGENRHRRVLVSPTTKMFPMEGSVGRLDAKTGKLHALPDAELAALASGYDLTLLESDGSRGLPCKGWRPDEPVVPPYATHTLGIVTLRAEGLPATPENCFQLDLFLALTGLTEGDPITLEALARMACAPEGMFRRGIGCACLLVNQVDTEADAAIARQWLSNVRAQYPGRFARLLWGSARQSIWNAL